MDSLLVSIPKMVRLIASGVLSFAIIVFPRFNSKDGAIDSGGRSAATHPSNCFNSKDGAIDSTLPHYIVPACLLVSIPKMVRLIGHGRRE